MTSDKVRICLSTFYSSNCVERYRVYFSRFFKCTLKLSRLRSCPGKPSFDSWREIFGPNWIFQQDNASIHTLGFTKNWFEANNDQVIEWASKSPDLNPIENLWRILVCFVYSNGRQFNSIPELRAKFVRSWDSITELQLKSLADSMNKRIIEVLKKNSKFIGYWKTNLFRD
jgi:transposase